MRVDAGVDTGPLLAQAREPIQADDTTASLGGRLARLGARLMAETLPKVLRGEIAPIEQDHAQATLSPKIEKAHGRIDWWQPAIHIDRMVRAYTPWPGALTTWNGVDLKIVRAAPTGQMTAAALHAVGQVIRPEGDRIGVVTGEGVLELREVQLAGKRAMSIDEFVRGQPKFVGAVLGTKDG
jgi:methionyl-tRNA formyltransferase